jgi:DNA-binding MarR family transcriptional regulator
MIDDTPLTETLSTWAETFTHGTMREMHRLLRGRGVSLSQFSVLMRLQHGGGCGVSDIGMYLGVSNPAASQLIDRLVEMNLLERSEDPADRRQRRLALTTQGQALLQEVIETRLRWLQNLAAALPPAEQPQVARTLALLTEAARAQEHAEPRPGKP